MDPFLNIDRVKARLMDEYRRHGQIIVAYDFDDTVFDYHGRGETYTEVAELLRRLSPYARFIVFTSCSEEKNKEIAEYLSENDIPFDAINEDIITKFKGRKIYYNILLDDRAGLREVFDTLNWFLKKVEQ